MCTSWCRSKPSDYATSGGALATGTETEPEDKVPGTHPSAQARGEVVEDEVGEGLGHSADVGDVVPHHHVVQGEVGGGPERQVAHHQAIWKHTRREPIVHTHCRITQDLASFGVYTVPANAFTLNVLEGRRSPYWIWESCLHGEDV